ncbi:MAG: nicotinate-nucleotide adenylyltransferase [Candidatus Omnitrophica bacterium]|nr:nicotinate-nucleotide adenylyltransferase [Candidatus Omnitrophota bacterium]
MRKIGLLGGTFDPIHIGHLLMARAALETLELDQVIFIPSCVPPHKKVPTLFLAKDRLKMVRLATSENPQFEVSDFEIKKGGKSYSVDTVRYFREILQPVGKLFFIVGGDAIKELDSWKDVDHLKKMCSFVSVNRPGYPRGEEKLKYHAVTMNGIEMSSTEIRKRILQGKSIQYLVPDSVLRYIKGNNLYKIIS